MVCWLGGIDGIPFGSYPGEKASQQSRAWKSTRRSGQIESIGDTTEFSQGGSPLTENSDYNFNSNVNANEVYPEIVRPDMERVVSGQEDSKESVGHYESDFPTHGSDSSNAHAEGEIPFVENDAPNVLENVGGEEDSPGKCWIDRERHINADSENLPRNRSSMKLLDALEDVGKLEATKTSSIRTGGDATLCWIETTTIKEDLDSRPTKRLVIREFTISLENSEAISADDIECGQMDGEILPGDEGAVCETSLTEVIEEDTSRSRVVNFVKVSQVGPIRVRREKNIKCAMGKVVFKDTYEWPDGSDNPRKRVDIKVAPTIRDVPSEACTSGNARTEPEEERGSSFESDCTSSEACETVGEDSEDFDRPSLPEELITSSTIPLPNGSAEADDYSCTKYGDCPIAEPAVLSEETENCSEEDCGREPSFEPPSESSEVDIEVSPSLTIKSTFIETTVTSAMSPMIEVSKLRAIATDGSTIDHVEMPSEGETESSWESSAAANIPSCIGSRSCKMRVGKNPQFRPNYEPVRGAVRPKKMHLLAAEEDSKASASEPESNDDDSSTTENSTETLGSDESRSRTDEEYETTMLPVDRPVTTMMTVETETPRAEAPGELLASVKDESLPDAEASAALGCPSGSLDSSGNCQDERTEVPSEESAEATSSTRSCEVSGNCEVEDESLVSPEEDPSAKLLESIEADPEVPGSSSGNRSCGSDSSSESCSSELANEATTTITESPEDEVEPFSSPSIESATSTTASDSRIASTLPSTILRAERKHRLGLKITVSLERINDDKENEKLVELEKYLLLNEGTLEGGNHSLVWKLRSLNNSENMETFESIFNCTSLENFTELLSHLTKFKGEGSAGASPGGESEAKGSASQDDDSARERREIPGSKDNVTKGVADATILKAIKGSPSGIDEDFRNGLGHVFQRISQEFEAPGTNEARSLAESASSTILKALADPTDGRIHAERRKRASDGRSVVSVEELEHPINGEEIDRWSKERFVEAANGARIRRFLEFNVLRDPTVTVRRIPSGS